jgi:ankyrin repeat protein
MRPAVTAAESLRAAIRRDDAAGVARVLDDHPDLKQAIDQPLEGEAFGQTALLAAVNRKHRETIDALLRAGANINQKSHWWAGGFHVLDSAAEEPWLASFLIGRGAVPEIHHAVRMGAIDDVRRMLAGDPQKIHARGGDGQLPLHFAHSVEMAEFLLNHGADVNARDVDHESTAAQWMIRDRQEVARVLVRRGSDVDILMAAALGDVERTAEILDATPDAIRTTVSERWFPKRDPRAGGTIYNWTLGSDESPHEVARNFGREAVLALLLARTPDAVKLPVACELGDRTLVHAVLSSSPSLRGAIAPEDRARLPAAARNNKTATVALMLEAGWPVEARGHENATALHWAAFHGNSEMVRALLAHGADPAVRGDVHNATPFNWAEYGAEHGWQCRTGDYETVIDLLKPKA